MQQIYRCILPENGLYYNQDKGTETKDRHTAYTVPMEKKEMKVTIKKSKISSYGCARWEVTINDCPVHVFMVRNADGDICLTWCDKNFDICTVKMFRGAPMSELKALFKALSYTL